jgi:hypothetical protein
MNKTLAATLIATGVGTGLWFLGFDKIVWPAHPGIAVLLITVVVGIVVSLVWPTTPGQ